MLCSKIKREKERHKHTYAEHSKRVRERERDVGREKERLREAREAEKKNWERDRQTDWKEKTERSIRGREECSDKMTDEGRCGGKGKGRQEIEYCRKRKWNIKKKKEIKEKCKRWGKTHIQKQN